MFNGIKNLITLKAIDKNISNKEFDIALEKLNSLIYDGTCAYEAYLRRGKLCKKLLMTDDAYSDFTYIISHCQEKFEAYKERLSINYETGNYTEAITDADWLIANSENNYEYKRIRFLSLLYMSLNEEAVKYVSELFDYNKYKIIHFLLTETAAAFALNEHAKSLKLLELINNFDDNNPLKLLNESTIYGATGNTDKQNELLKQIENEFPKYFISHFKYTDMYEARNIYEIYFLLEMRNFDKHNLFTYQMTLLEGYKNWEEGHISDAKEAFEKAVNINPEKPEGYVLLAQTLQLMSGYDNPEYIKDAEDNYKKAMEIYQKEKLPTKVDEMKRQIKHLNSSISLI